MGQCISQYADDSNYISSQREEDAKRDFLAVHKRDRQHYSILNLDEVDEVIGNQIDESVCQEQRSGNTEYSVAYDTIEESRSNVSVEQKSVIRSTIHPSFLSTVTSGTEATRMASNLDRYAMKKKFRERTAASRQRMDAIAETKPKTKPKATKHQRQHCGGASVSDPTKFCEYSSRNHNEYENMAGSCLPLYLLGQYFTGETFSQQSIPQSLDHKYSDILFLKMKVHLVSFYKNCYLPLFPNSPKPMGMHVQSSRSPSPNHMIGSSKKAQSLLDLLNIPSSPVLLDIDNSSFLDLAVCGSLGMVDRSNDSTFATVTPPRTQKSPNHYITLVNRQSGIPLAVCALKSPSGSPVVRIFSTKQRSYTQRPAATTVQLGLKWTTAYPLYSWAEFSIDGGYREPMQYSLRMSKGSNGLFEKEPSYKGHHGDNGSPDIMVMGKTENEEVHTGCALISIKTDESNTFGDDTSFSLAISRGVDPALFICLAAILDETIEKNMRLQCELRKFPVLNRSDKVVESHTPPNTEKRTHRGRSPVRTGGPSLKISRHQPKRPQPESRPVTMATNKFFDM